MKHAIYTWEKGREQGDSMPRELLEKEVENFIKVRSNCSLATGYGTYIRNTPMRYSYKNGNFLFITEGGYKFKGLILNKNVSISIFDTNNLSSNTVGMTIEGEASVTEFSEKDRKITDARKFLITVVPKSIDFLNSNFTSNGYYPLQHLDYI